MADGSAVDPRRIPFVCRIVEGLHRLIARGLARFRGWPRQERFAVHVRVFLFLFCILVVRV